MLRTIRSKHNKLIQSSAKNIQITIYVLMTLIKSHFMENIADCIELWLRNKKPHVKKSNPISENESPED